MKLQVDFRRFVCGSHRYSCSGLPNGTEALIPYKKKEAAVETVASLQINL